MKPIPARQWDFPAASLLMLALFIACQRLYITDWAPGLEFAILLTIFGGALGLALGYSTYRRTAVTVFIIGFSIVLIPLVAGGVFYDDTPWLERMISMGGRLGYSLGLFFNSRPVPDTILFVALAALGFWVISLLAGYALTRYSNFVGATVPAGIALIIIQLYDARSTDRIFMIAIYLILCLLLLGRLTFIHNRSQWKAQRVAFSAESATNLNLSFAVAALVLVALTWIVPASAHPPVSARVFWENLTRPFRETRKELGNAVAGLQNGGRVVVAEFYADTLSLGLQASDDDSVYLEVRAPLVGGVDRYYWRVRTYDTFTNNNWRAAYSFTEPFTSTQGPLSVADSQGLSGEFVFEITRDYIADLITPPRVVWLSRPVTVTFAPATGNQIDPFLFRANPPLKVGEQYVVHANLFSPTIDQLEKAGAVYPAWVQDHYLQLPEDLLPEIVSLAQQITADAKTPYEKAQAITNYLRANITYSKTVAPPPPGRDALSYFLLDSRTGFCNYYATAEVILLRAVGVPARMAVGFAQGEYQPPDRYTVRVKDAHAWPEVYFPGLGWVEFEPTSNQPELKRLPGGTVAAEQSSGQAPAEGGNQVKPPAEDESDNVTRSARPVNSLQRLLIIFIVFVVLLIGGFVAYTYGLFDRFIGSSRLSVTRLPVLVMSTYENLSLPPPAWLRRWVHQAGLSPIERSFSVVYQALRWLGAAPVPSQTPAEAAAALTLRLPDSAVAIRSLAREYQLTLFSQQHADYHEAARAVTLIRRAAFLGVVRQRVEAVKAVFRRVPPPRPE